MERIYHSNLHKSDDSSFSYIHNIHNIRKPKACAPKRDTLLIAFILSEKEISTQSSLLSYALVNSENRKSTKAYPEECDAIFLQDIAFTSTQRCRTSLATFLCLEVGKNRGWSVMKIFRLLYVNELYIKYCYTTKTSVFNPRVVFTKPLLSQDPSRRGHCKQRGIRSCTGTMWRIVISAKWERHRKFQWTPSSVLKRPRTKLFSKLTSNISAITTFGHCQPGWSAYISPREWFSN